MLKRRLRHLRNIAARNIVNRNGYKLLDTYFTLHLCSSEKICKEFYRREVIKNSLPPPATTLPAMMDCNSPGTRTSEARQRAAEVPCIEKALVGHCVKL